MEDTAISIEVSADPYPPKESSASLVREGGIFGPGPHTVSQVQYATGYIIGRFRAHTILAVIRFPVGKKALCQSRHTALEVNDFA